MKEVTKKIIFNGNIDTWFMLFIFAVVMSMFHSCNIRVKCLTERQVAYYNSVTSIEIPTKGE